PLRAALTAENPIVVGGAPASVHVARAVGVAGGDVVVAVVTVVGIGGVARGGWADGFGLCRVPESITIGISKQSHLADCATRHGTVHARGRRTAGARHVFPVYAGAAFVGSPIAIIVVA